MPSSPAGRVALVMFLLHPTDEDGEPMEPFISAADAKRLLDGIE